MSTDLPSAVPARLPGARDALVGQNIEFTAIRSQGPGGQHVNKAATAVQLRFHIPDSSLPDAVKARLMRLRDHRIGSDGTVVIKAQGSRSQDQNRADALERLVELVQRAWVAPRARKPTRPTQASRRRRLEGKAQRAAVKAGRTRVDV